AITAALFLDEFVSRKTDWVHMDTMGYNLSHRPGRPPGGEALGLLALDAMLAKRYLGIPSIPAASEPSAEPLEESSVETDDVSPETNATQAPPAAPRRITKKPAAKKRTAKKTSRRIPAKKTNRRGT